jgi:hypothetical protein
MTPKPPPNDGNLPTFTDADGNIRIAWRGFTIREQFPSTRALGERP